ncbi:MAG: 4Fe-4S binding protein [Bacteroidales bacterium]|nr:4Fe-4S binding protein [Bacteroidales bacterium]
MLHKIRIALAIVFITFTTLLFLDFTGTIHIYFGWMAKIQFVPALLALNIAVVLALLVLTFVFGRIYCSVICPLGILQDIFARFGRKAKKNRYSYSPARKWLRIIVMVLFFATIIAPGVGVIAHLIAPYSAFGRIASNLFQPIYLYCNNLLAYISERAGTYTFYSTEVWLKSVSTFAIAAATLIVVAVLAWRNGRTWCNTICPVGTLLGFFSRYSLLKPVIDTTKCNSCGLCARNCKAACINAKEHEIDYSRCVTCFDCIGKCRQNAISYKFRSSAAATDSAPADKSRRNFIAVGSMLAVGAAVNAQEKKVDGGFATIVDKQIPARELSPKPAGSLSIKNFTNSCTACQLCVSACPNQVLRPSTDLEHFMQPEMSFERGYCRPECVRCSEVCPAGAIRPITTAQKSSISVGYAVLLKENCLAYADDVRCGNCARHCPVGAIYMVPKDPQNPDSTLIPSVNTERCIGCGACENLCPVRPLSAIYVEGRQQHVDL